MGKDTYTVERSIVVDADPASVYARVADFRGWTSWSPWEDVDPDMTRTYSGPDSGTGSVYTWSGNRRAGAGRMEITSAVEPSRVEIDLAFEKPWKARNVTTLTMEPQGSSTVVSWTMTGKETLMTKAMGLFTSMEKFLGRDFEKGLGRLKTVVESSDGSA